MFWKILFFIYTAFILCVSATGISPDTEMTTKTIWDELITLSVVIFWILAMVYTYALGWKKQLLGKIYNKYILWGGIAATLIAGVQTFLTLYPPAYDEVLMYGMQQGMVPRNIDFQFLLLITRTTVTLVTLVYLFLLYAPFYIGYYFYGKNMEKFSTVKFAGRKIFTCFMFVNIFPVIFLYLLGSSGYLARYNVYDFLTIFYMSFLLIGLYGYAFAKKIFNKTFWMITMPIIAALTLIPQHLLSVDFVKLVGDSNFQSEPLITISSWAISLGALYLVYKYAYTNEVFNNTEKEVTEQKNTAETVTDSANNYEDK